MEFDLATVAYIAIMLVNVYWTWQARKMQNKDDVIKMLRGQLEDKEKYIADLIKKKNEYKHQYNNILAERNKLHGENLTYKNFHGHPKV